MTTGREGVIAACGHAVKIGTCTLPSGHTLGHHDEVGGFQWWDREDDYGPGAYASIQMSDRAYRHEYGWVPPWQEADEHVPWCAWCLRDLLRRAGQYLDAAGVWSEDDLMRQIAEAAHV